MSFLPINKEDMKTRGWDQLDFLYISGDAYVDHPSFGHAIITRVLENEGYRVGIIAQPNWKEDKDFLKMGRPRLAVLISSGVIDSMVNHYTATKKPRSTDVYSPSGEKGKRPDRAVIVYASKIKGIFKGVPVIIGGIEASLRRFAHYDFWQEKVRGSILKDSKADLLIYGMGEKPIIEIARLLDKGASISKIVNIKGTCYLSKDIVKEAILINSLEEVVESKELYAKSYYIQSTEQDPIRGKTIIQKHGDRYLVQNPPGEILSQKEMDRVYALPYMRTWHPEYNEKGGVPAFKEVEFSITSQRGCFGSCAFCSLGYHQGRIIQSRSHDSIINEAKILINNPEFKGYINDVGGPTANFRNPACREQLSRGVCESKHCLYPDPCESLEINHDDYLNLLRKLRKLPNVKKVFIRSGIRYDYLIQDKDGTFFKELCEHHISGQLKVAPEHISENVLELMEKPNKNIYDTFTKRFDEINKKLNKKQFLVPYFISGHPGSTLTEAIELALYIKDMGYMPEQVQQFYPTPGSMATTMYYTGLNPKTMEKVYVAKLPKEKAMQRALLQFQKPENHKLVKDALMEAGRMDLIGFDKTSLIPPRVIKIKK